MYQKCVLKGALEEKDDDCTVKDNAFFTIQMQSSRRSRCDLTGT